MKANSRQPAARVPSWPWERLPYGRWLGHLALAGLMLVCAWALAYWPLGTVAALLAAAGAGLVIVVWPPLGLALLAVAVPFGSLRAVNLGPARLGGEEVVLAVTAAAWLARQLARRSLQLTWPAFVGAGLVLLGAMLLSFLPASSLLLAAKEMLKWAELWLAAVLAVNLVDERSALLLVVALLAAAAAEGLYGLYQFFARVGPSGFVLMGRFMRASGTFEQPNPYGGYLGLALPLALGLVLTAWPGRARGQGGEGQAWGLWAAAAGAGVLIAGGLFASWSRGAWLGAAAGVAIVVVARGGSWLRGALAIGLTGLVVCFLVWGRVPLPGALADRFSGFVADLTTFDVRDVEVTDANFAVVERAAHWQAALGMFRDHPWTGVGLGNYPEAYAQYALPRWPDPLGHAHNYFLNIAAEAGLPGLVAYLLWVAAGLWVAVQAVRRSQGLWQGVALGVLGMWVHLNVHNLFDNLYVHGMGIHIGLMLGLAAWLIATQAGGAATDAHRR